MNKKGDISINVIIIAALALIVLVLVGAILTTRLGGFAGVVETGCVPNGGRCILNSEDCDTVGTDFLESSNYNCAEGRVCCVPRILDEQR